MKRRGFRRKSRTRPPTEATRHRVTQEVIDQMTELRRQGLTFKNIGARVGSSERTARRYVSHVRVQLALPTQNPEPDTDPRSLRERFVKQFLEALYHDQRLHDCTFAWVQKGPDYQEAVYGPPSVLFLSEAERLIREQLERTGELALQLMARDRKSQARFLRETVGSLYWDYVRWHEFASNFGAETGEDWRPARERPLIDDGDLPEDFQD